MAKAIRYIGQEDFDLFSDSDRNAMMALVEDYFCGDEPTEMSSGKPRLRGGGGGGEGGGTEYHKRHTLPVTCRRRGRSWASPGANQRRW